MNNHCNIPPEGWACTRKPGHDGPCAATPTGKSEEKIKEEIKVMLEENGLQYKYDFTDVLIDKIFKFIPSEDHSEDKLGMIGCRVIDPSYIPNKLDNQSSIRTISNEEAYQLAQQSKTDNENKWREYWQNENKCECHCHFNANKETHVGDGDTDICSIQSCVHCSKLEKELERLEGVSDHECDFVCQTCGNHYPVKLNRSIWMKWHKQQLKQQRSEVAREIKEETKEEKLKLIRAIKTIIHTDAVIAVLAVPEVGEVFDIEKHNYANRKLNELSNYLLARLNAIKTELLENEE